MPVVITVCEYEIVQTDTIADNSKYYQVSLWKKILLNIR